MFRTSALRNREARTPLLPVPQHARSLCAFLLLASAMFSPPAKAQPAGYAYARAITVDAAQVSGTDSLVDFPLNISLQASDLRDTLNGGFVCHAQGYDLLFTGPDCSTVLDYQLERFDASTGTVVAWVRIPVLRTDSNTVVYLFYGNDGIGSDPSTTDAWDNHYVGVWHMADDPSGSSPAMPDNSRFSHDADANGYSSDDRGDGIAGQGLVANGSGQYLTVDSSGLTPAALSFSGQQAISISAWVRYDAMAGEKSIVELGHSTDDVDIPYWLGHNGSNMQIRLASGSPATGNRYNGSSTLSTGTWYHMAYTYDGSTLKGYLNGVEEISVARSGDIAYTAADGFRMGKRFDARYMEGTVDEVRISRFARSADWWATQYANLADAESFYAVSPYTTAEDLCSNGVPVPSVPDLSCYTGRIAFSIDADQVSGSSNLTDFPFLVVLQHDTLKSTANGGLMEHPEAWDLSFTAADETTQLDFELEAYNGTTGEVKAWVKVPTLYHNIDTELFCYFGCSTANMDPSTAGTWSNGFLAVWHMAEAPNGSGEALEDHSANGSDAAPRGFSTDAREAALVEDGIRLDGSSQYFGVEDGGAVPSHLTLEDSAALTLSAWVNIDAFGGEKSVLEKSRGTSDNQIRYFLGMADNKLQVRLHAGATSGRHDGTTNLTVGKDHYLVLTYNGASLLGYLDGAEEISVARSGNIVHNSADDLRMGKRSDGRYVDGLVDELRIAHVARSAGWIQTEYNNLYDPVSSISDITASDNPLPVTLLFFEGASREAQVNLHWATATERNSAAFAVERSRDGQHWQFVERIQAAGTSSQRLDYHTVDRRPLDGQSYYRLRQQDRNGHTRTVGVFALWRESGAAPSWQLYPNPLQGRTLFVRGLDPDQRYVATLLAGNGRLIGEWPVEGGKLRLPELQAGLYAVRILHRASGRQQTLHVAVR